MDLSEEGIPSLTRLSFADDVDVEGAEFSSLAWFRDRNGDEALALLEQSAIDDAGAEFENGLIRLISKPVLREALQNGTPISKSRIRTMTLDASALPAQPSWTFDGYEAVAFSGETVWVAAEFEPDHGVVSMGLLCRGRVEVVEGKLVARLTECSAPLLGQASVKNMAYEAMLLVGQERTVLIYEANGCLQKYRSSSPRHWSYSDLGEAPTAGDFPTTEYRITDATEIRGDRFWVTNYFFPGEGELKPRNLRASGPVERLLEFRLTEGRLSKTGKAIALRRPDSKSPARNWEGIAWFDDPDGFLVVTDANDESHGQETILAFISASENR